MKRTGNDTGSDCQSSPIVRLFFSRLDLKGLRLHGVVELRLHLYQYWVVYAAKIEVWRKAVALGVAVPRYIFLHSFDTQRRFYTSSLFSTIGIILRYLNPSLL